MGCGASTAQNSIVPNSLDQPIRKQKSEHNEQDGLPIDAEEDDNEELVRNNQSLGELFEKSKPIPEAEDWNARDIKSKNVLNKQSTQNFLSKTTSKVGKPTHKQSIDLPPINYPEKSEMNTQMFSRLEAAEESVSNNRIRKIAVKVDIATQKKDIKFILAEKDLSLMSAEELKSKIVKYEKKVSAKSQKSADPKLVSKAKSSQKRPRCFSKESGDSNTKESSHGTFYGLIEQGNKNGEGLFVW